MMPLEDTKPEENTVKYGPRAALQYMRSFISDVLDLQHGVDKRATIKEIRDKKSMSGANAWMLLCSIMIASIGLSLNSPAVIIGAMLISPLMSPILGIGLSVGINDMDTLRKSLIHFGVAMIIAILTSTIYFTAVGFIEMTPEIEARTQPTFLDVFVAIFGGLAGIISVARKDISTTLPGVAIATALMPPLCVTGFGLAHGDWEIASRSFYLFFLNTYFVALSTYVIVRLLNFPYKDYVKRNERRKNALYLIGFSLLLTIPSLMIFRGLIEDVDRERALRAIKKECLGSDALYVDDYEYVQRRDTSDLLVVKIYGTDIGDERRQEYAECMVRQGLSDVELVMLPSAHVNLDHIQSLKNDLSGLNDHIKMIEDRSREQERLLSRERLHLDSMEVAGVIRELYILYPDMSEVAIGELSYMQQDSSMHSYPTLTLEVPGQSRIDQSRVVAFVRERLTLDTLILLR